MFRFENLDDITRRYMLLEVNQAIQDSQLHLSQRFTAQGRELYPGLLHEAVQTGDAASLTTALQAQGCFAEREAYGTGPAAYRPVLPVPSPRVSSMRSICGACATAPCRLGAW